MSVTVHWSGLAELAEALAALPDAVQQEAAPIIRAAGEQHLAAMRSRFPAQSVTGTLAASLTLEQTGPLTTRVYSRAPHAHLYEFGFAHTSGRQVAGHQVFVPEAQQIRAQMVADLEGVIAKAAARSTVLEAR